MKKKKEREAGRPAARKREQSESMDQSRHTIMKRSKYHQEISKAPKSKILGTYWVAHVCVR